MFWPVNFPTDNGSYCYQAGSSLVMKHLMGMALARETRQKLWLISGIIPIMTRFGKLDIEFTEVISVRSNLVTHHLGRLVRFGVGHFNWTSDRLR